MEPYRNYSLDPRVPSAASCRSTPSCRELSESRRRSPTVQLIDAQNEILWQDRPDLQFDNAWSVLQDRNLRGVDFGGSAADHLALPTNRKAIRPDEVCNPGL